MPGHGSDVRNKDEKKIDDLLHSPGVQLTAPPHNPHTPIHIMDTTDAVIQHIPVPEEQRLEDLAFIYDAASLPNTDLTQEIAKDVERRFIDYWCEPPVDGVSLYNWALDRLGVRTPEEEQSLSCDQIHNIAAHRAGECMMVLTLMKKGGNYKTTDGTRIRIARGFTSFKKAYELVKIHLVSPFIFDETRFEGTSLPQEVTAWQMNFVHRSLDQFVPAQQLIVTTLDRLMQDGYRRFGSEVYKEIIGHNDLGTRAWEPVCDIDEYVYKSISKDTNARMWEIATSNGSVIPETVKYLTNCYDIEFRPLVPERSLFSFRNGQYDAKALLFRSSEDGGVAGDRCSVRYFDVMFKEELVIKEWRHIETPLFDSIFEHQGFSRGTIDVVYAILGRLLFKVNENDQWQVAPFFKGVAGCGKSTVAAIVSYWYPPKFVSTISCNMEDRFGLANIVDTFMTWCTEVTSHFPLPRGVWQSMVTGEPVVVPRKNKSAIQGAWTVPIAMAGNELFGYEDKSCSVHRRTVIFPMKKTVDKDKADPMLLEKLKADPAPLLVKCIRAYDEMHRLHGDGSFWSAMATQEMKEWHTDLLKEIDTISAFFVSSTLKHGMGEYVLEVDLKKAYKNWVQEEGFKFNAKDWSTDHMSTIYDRHKCELTNKSLTYPKGSAQLRTGLFVMNVSLVEDEQRGAGPNHSDFTGNMDVMGGINGSDGSSL